MINTGNSSGYLTVLDKNHPFTVFGKILYATKVPEMRPFNINSSAMKIRTIFTFLLLSAAFVFAPVNSNAQTDPSTFTIPPFTYGDPIEEKLFKAVCEADMDIYRLRNTRRVLNFDNQGTIILYSAEELKAQGKNIDLSQYPESLPEGYKEPVYVLSTDGKLVQLFSPQTATK